MIDQTSYAARQTSLAIRSAKISMYVNFALLILFILLVVWGIMQEPVYTVTTSDIFPSRIYPAKDRELYGINFKMDRKTREFKEETESVRIKKEGEALMDVVTNVMPPVYDRKEIIPKGNH